MIVPHGAGTACCFLKRRVNQQQTQQCTLSNCSLFQNKSRFESVHTCSSLSHPPATSTHTQHRRQAAPIPREGCCRHSHRPLCRLARPLGGTGERYVDLNFASRKRCNDNKTTIHFHVLYVSLRLINAGEIELNLCEYSCYSSISSQYYNSSSTGHVVLPYPQHTAGIVFLREQQQYL